MRSRRRPHVGPQQLRYAAVADGYALSPAANTVPPNPGARRLRSPAESAMSPGPRPAERGGYAHTGTATAATSAQVSEQMKIPQREQKQRCGQQHLHTCFTGRFNTGAVIGCMLLPSVEPRRQNSIRVRAQRSELEPLRRTPLEERFQCLFADRARPPTLLRGLFSSSSHDSSAADERNRGTGRRARADRNRSSAAGRSCFSVHACHQIEQRVDALSLSLSQGTGVLRGSWRSIEVEVVDPAGTEHAVVLGEESIAT